MWLEYPPHPAYLPSNEVVPKKGKKYHVFITVPRFRSPPSDSAKERTVGKQLKSNGGSEWESNPPVTG